MTIPRVRLHLLIELTRIESISPQGAKSDGSGCDYEAATDLLRVVLERNEEGHSIAVSRPPDILLKLRLGAEVKLGKVSEISLCLRDSACSTK